MRGSLLPACVALALLGQAGSATAAELTVTMPAKKFSPARVVAVPGDTVRWRNVDTFDAHNVFATDLSFQSPRLARFGAFTRTVTDVGTISYVCTLHLGMGGAIDVVAAALDAPKGPAVAGQRIALTGRAPAGPVVLERQDPGGWTAVARTATDAGGAFSATVAAQATAAWRAVGAAGPGPAVTVPVASTLRVTARKAPGGVRATVRPAPAGARAVLQLYSRWHYMWQDVRRAPLPRAGTVAFRVRDELRPRARVVIRRADGTELGRSAVVRLDGRRPRAGRDGGPAPARPPAEDPHAHHAVAAASFRTDLPEIFAELIEQAKADDSPPILLPDAIRTEHRRLFASGGADRRSYDLSLATVRDCGGATACFVASFSGERGGKPAGRRVRLRGGRRGWFTPMRCGASCAPPRIQWRRGRVLHTIAAKIGTEKTERSRLVALANEAIAAGPR